MGKVCIVGIGRDKEKLSCFNPKSGEFEGGAELREVQGGLLRFRGPHRCFGGRKLRLQEIRRSSRRVREPVGQNAEDGGGESSAPLGRNKLYVLSEK